MVASADAGSDTPLFATQSTNPSSRLALTGLIRSTDPPVISMIVYRFVDAG